MKAGCHILRFALYGFASLCLWEESCRMSQFAALCSWEREAVTRYGLLCFALLWLVWFARGKLSHVTICFALPCFASLCTAMLCFALHCIAHLCNDKKML